MTAEQFTAAYPELNADVYAELLDIMPHAWGPTLARPHGDTPERDVWWWRGDGLVERQSGTPRTTTFFREVPEGVRLRPATPGELWKGCQGAPDEHGRSGDLGPWGIRKDRARTDSEEGSHPSPRVQPAGHDSRGPSPRAPGDSTQGLLEEWARHENGPKQLEALLQKYFQSCVDGRSEH